MKLEKIAEESKARAFSFSAPKGVALPFGSMEVAAETCGKRNYIEERLAILDDEKSSHEHVETARMEIFSFIKSDLHPSKETYQRVLNLMGDDNASSKVIFRSSANFEDLAGLSAAGLYDSIPNVNLSSYDQFADAVSKVWASLYTSRAVASRKAAGVS